MSLVLFKYCLPLALGYGVSACLSGSLRTWKVPEQHTDRPLWFLGLWCGGVIAVALATLAHMAHQAPLQEALAHLKPLVGTALLLLLAGAVLALGFSQRRLRPARELPRALEADSAADSTVAADPRDDAFLATAVAEADIHQFLESQTQALAHADCEPDAIVDLRSELHAETRLRVETEKHLRITRKALHVLESQARDHEAARTDVMIGLEEQLESQVRHSAGAESRLQREIERVADLEIAMIDMKRELLEAKRSTRQGMQARAKALATAHKALAHARRSLHGRSRMEARITEMQAALNTRQQTITSLIKTLEQEKSRNDEQIGERARQMLLHQRQIQARRAVESAASISSGKPGSRLIKRIAKARRIEGSAN